MKLARRAAARIAARRRLAVVCSAALTASLAGGTFTMVTAAPASANTLSGYCLDANAQQAYNFGAIAQWACNPYDEYQNWVLAGPRNTDYGPAYQFDNYGTYQSHERTHQGPDTCLDADAQQVYNGGAVIQFACAGGQDPYELWIEESVGGGYYQFMNYGDLLYKGVAMCLDASEGQQNNGGAIIQYACNKIDAFQDWSLGDGAFGPSGGRDKVLYGLGGATEG